jgi:molybdate transport system permease protein
LPLNHKIQSSTDPKQAASRSVPRRRVWFLFVIPSILMLALFALPLLALAWRAVGPDFFDHLLSPTALSALRLSLMTSLISVLIILLTGTPLAYLLARAKFPGRNLVELLIDLPIVLPPSVAGLALLMAFGRRGLLGEALGLFGISLPFTTAAVVMAQVFVAAPFYIRAARVGFASVDPHMAELAVTEGAGAWQLFYDVMLPLCRRPMLNGMILCWTRALGEFGATILFAGNMVGRTQTMPLAIYMGFERDLGIVLALSLFLLIFSGLLLAWLRHVESR